MTDNNKPSRILYDAIDLLDEHGWARTSYEDSRGRLCTMGAIHKAITGDPAGGVMSIEVFISSYKPAREALTDEISKAAWNKYGNIDIVRWNDTVVRDKRTVQRTMKRVAKRLEKEGR